MDFVTCDLSDDNADIVSVVTGLNWFSYGSRKRFGGEIVTVKCFEDNSLVKEELGNDGKGKVMEVRGDEYDAEDAVPDLVRDVTRRIELRDGEPAVAGVMCFLAWLRGYHGVILRIHRNRAFYTPAYVRGTTEDRVYGSPFGRRLVGTVSDDPLPLT